MQHATPLLAAIDQIQLATTYAWASNEPESKYYEADAIIRNRHLADLDRACDAYLTQRGYNTNVPPSTQF